MRLNMLIFAIAAAAVIPQLASAHLLSGSKGPVSAFNYDEAAVNHLNEDCALAFECKPNDSKGVYFYNCYYDVYSSECQCSEGDFSKCDVGRSSLSAKEAAAIRGGSNGVLGLAVNVVAKPFKLVYAKFAALPIFGRAAILLILVAAAVFIFSRLRGSAANNLRKARELHEQASGLHEKGDEDGAKLLFEKSDYHREKAYEQMQSKVQ